jgi:hypothetical protein
MSEERGPHEEWDRSQWPEEGTSPDAPAAETWDRDQMKIDPPADDDAERDPASAADSGGLSGGGQPSGESHWERVDED